MLHVQNKRGRGRPKKESEPQESIEERTWPAAHADLDDLNTWEINLNTRINQEFPTLKPKQLSALAKKLTHAGGYYKCGEKLRTSQQSKTNKPHIDTQILIHDCSKVWEEITGQSLKSWQSSNKHSNKLVEPPAFKLARIVAEVAGERKLLSNLRRQAKHAKQIQTLENIPPPKTN